jgi:hypothetical protein
MNYLKESDTSFLSNFHITPEIRVAWLSYRQALRDATKDKILSNTPFKNLEVLKNLCFLESLKATDLLFLKE